MARCDVTYSTGTRLPASWWQGYIRKTQRVVGKQLGEISVAIVSSAEIKRLNRTYKNNDSVTDVLSFADRDMQDARLKTKHYSGEIIICYQRAKQQAKQFKHTIREELGLLFVHGLLHILGYDHITAREAKKMRDFEAKILGSTISRTEGC